MAEAPQMTRLILARAEPTPEMQKTGANAHKAMKAVRLYGGIMNESLTGRAGPRAKITAAYTAMLQASPALTPVEVDGLCRAMWGADSHWHKWWDDPVNGSATESRGDAIRCRDNDRARMLAFIAALATLETPNG